MKKQGSLLALIGLIVVAFYNVVVFVIAGFEGHTATFWISYGGMMLAFVIAGASAFIFTKSGTGARDWFLGAPIVRYTIIFLVAEFIVTTIFLIAQNAPWVITFLLQLLFMAVYLILTISCIFAKNVINNVRKEVKEKTAFIGLLQADAQVLVELCTDMEAKKAFSAFAEAVRYSDPMSSPVLQSVELELQDCVRAAKKSLQAGDIEDALSLCSQSQVLLKERNAKCKVLKD